MTRKEIEIAVFQKPTKASREHELHGHARNMGGHISQKWYEFTTGDQEIDRYG